MRNDNFFVTWLEYKAKELHRIMVRFTFLLKSGTLLLILNSLLIPFILTTKTFKCLLELFTGI
jgi:hypothetical protein